MFVGFFLIVYGIFSPIFSPNDQRTLWVVDTSLSMSVEDVTDNHSITHSRLNLAQELIASGAELIPGMHALMTFSDIARLQIPFIRDSSFFSLVSKNLTPHIYGIGTDIPTVIQSIESIYPWESLQVVLLTDGENSRLPSEFPILGKEKKIVIIGIGTEAGGPILEGYAANGYPIYKQFQWKNAISRMDRSFLEQLRDHYDAKLFFTTKKNDILWILHVLNVESHSHQNQSNYSILLFWVLAVIFSYFILPFRYVSSR
jgi:von Willebrand factor type A domain